jgi:polyadenylate-binding protein
MLARSFSRLSTLSAPRVSLFCRSLSSAPARNGVDIYLGNLEYSITAETLKTEINKRYDGEFGGPRIVFNKEERKSLGFGYITVPSNDAATAVITALQGMVLNDQEVKVDIGQERRIFRSAFFGNLELTVTDEELKEFLENMMGAGSVTKVRLAKNEDGASRGFAHVDFKESSMRDRALAETNGLELKGRPLKVDKAVLKTRLPVVYIGNISYDVTKEHMEQMLDEVVGHGNYTDIRLHYDRITGYPRGFCHVTFLTKRIGNKAVEELNGIEMMGRPLRANFATDKPAERDNRQQHNVE